MLPSYARWPMTSSNGCFEAAVPPESHRVGFVVDPLFWASDTGYRDKICLQHVEMKRGYLESADGGRAAIRDVNEGKWAKASCEG